MNIVFNEKYDEEIRQLVEQHPKNFIGMLKSKAVHKDKAIDRTYLLEYILQVTPLLNDSFYTLKTKVYWVLNKLTDFPYCLNDTCGKHKMTKCNVKNIKFGYGKYCNTKCQHESKTYFEDIRRSVQNKYGQSITNVFQLQSVKDKMHEMKDEIEAKKKQTRIMHFGDEPGWNLKQSIMTRKKKYGSTWNIAKIKETKLQRYGDAGFNNIDKNFNTRKLNGTMSSSKQEDAICKLLYDILGEDKVERQHKSDAYPFHCDFYIKDIDLYIECNFSWTHGGHWFNDNDTNDVQLLQKWKDKNTKYYNNAIQTWTVRDKNKHDAAIKNKLNYLVFWTYEDAYNTLNNKNFFTNIINIKKGK